MPIVGLSWLIVAMTFAFAPAENLDAHLAAWANAVAARKSVRFDVTLRRTNLAGGVFKNPTMYNGSILIAMPDKYRLRLDNAADSKDFEAFVCNGKSVFAYSGVHKTVTEYKHGGWLHLGWHHLALDEFLPLSAISGRVATGLTNRFDVKLFKEDQFYIYLDLKPKRDKDKQDFQSIRMALFGPKTPFAYLPAQIYIVKSNGETEQWKLSKPQVNIPDLDPKKLFEYEKIPGFRLQKSLDLSSAKAAEPPAAESATEVVWAIPAVPCDRVGRGVFRPRCGLFRNRIAGYKCATAGAVPVTVEVIGVSSCDPPALPSSPPRLRFRLAWLSRRGCPRRQPSRRPCRRRLPRPTRSSTPTSRGGKRP
jgi:TIGR03009 family protein